MPGRPVVEEGLDPFNPESPAAAVVLEAVRDESAPPRSTEILPLSISGFSRP
jgi:hypothetical protein